MNREFEFRAWLTKYNKMVNIYSWNIWQEYFMCSEYDSEFYLEETPIMQYTGLKDKNNKEIYEGDIVTLHNGKYKVIFNTKEARFVLRDDEFEMNIPFTNNNNKRMEIIGNIYENPELIKE